jgi:hypothetical protein
MPDYVLGIYRQLFTLVAHRVTDAQRQIRLDRSNELPGLLESAQTNDWQSFRILDESWFYLGTNHEKVLLQARQQPPERVKHMISQSTYYGRFSRIGLNCGNGLP